MDKWLLAGFLAGFCSGILAGVLIAAEYFMQKDRERMRAEYGRIEETERHDKREC